MNLRFIIENFKMFSEIGYFDIKKDSMSSFNLSQHKIPFWMTSDFPVCFKVSGLDSNLDLFENLGFVDKNVYCFWSSILL